MKVIKTILITLGALFLAFLGYVGYLTFASIDSGKIIMDGESVAHSITSELLEADLNYDVLIKHSVPDMQNHVTRDDWVITTSAISKHFGSFKSLAPCQVNLDVSAHIKKDYIIAPYLCLAQFEKRHLLVAPAMKYLRFEEGGTWKLYEIRFDVNDTANAAKE